MKPYSRKGISIDDMQYRYDVPVFLEDSWHLKTEDRTNKIVCSALSRIVSGGLVLNVGSGSYRIPAPHLNQVCLDLFRTPLHGQPAAVCGNAEKLPFRGDAFDAVVCVGEVIAYCDPIEVMKEASRTIKPGGVFVVDFGSTDSARFLLTKVRGRFADIVTVPYNGTAEKTWVYNYRYMRGILESCSFRIIKTFGTHAWSSLVYRMLGSTWAALLAEDVMGKISHPIGIADTITMVAKKI